MSSNETPSFNISSRRKHLQRTPNASDSEDSDNESVTRTRHVDETDGPKSRRLKHMKTQKSDAEWVIVEGLKDGQTWQIKPDKLESYLMKRRKWPLKGWHKRYFCLENGILTYAKSPSDILKGKLHGLVDIGLSVISYKFDGQRIDIDADDLIHHVKVKGTEFFKEWIEKLRVHRLYRQHEIAYGTSDNPRLSGISSPDESKTVSPDPIEERRRTLTLHRDFSLQRDSSIKARSSSQSKVAAWLIDNSGIEQCNKELQNAQSRIFDLTNFLAQMHDIQATSDQVFDVSPMEPSTTKKSSLSHKLRLKNRKEKVKSGGNNSDTGSIASLVVSSTSSITNGSDKSSTSLNTTARPVSLPADGTTGTEKRYVEMQIREDFLSTAREVQDSLKALVRTISTERDRLRKFLETESINSTPSNNALTNSLKTAYNDALKQNQELKAKLSKIHEMSGVVEPSSKFSSLEKTVTPTRDLLSQSLSIESASIAEFFDASEYLGGPPTSSSEASGSEESDEEGSSISDVETETDNTTSASVISDNVYRTGRRDKLPAPRADTGDISLWNLLCKNIGKDLSKIAMPVTLNEPLNVLQRLCEELEYSDLLDKAAVTDDPIHRMVLVAAFAVSGYSSTFHRAGQKPFNPLLGETYECVREDKGWKFIAEQVSHHPPISACHCESNNFQFWQETRIRNKFWGKSMEIHPIGTVNVRLPQYNEHYTWNKVTSCVHNILSGQRWIDHYGQMVIQNGQITCKLVFEKTRYWSTSRHEVQGTITDREGKTVQHLFGKWMEGLYCGHSPSAKCVWRPGAIPQDYELYYGFTRFAIELNELDDDLRPVLPITDTRLRPDQRLLEEGRIQEAESEKIRLEHLQRERRKDNDRNGVKLRPKWFRVEKDSQNQEKYVYKDEYWETRQDGGFNNSTLVPLW